jgi:hypothetical protein
VRVQQVEIGAVVETAVKVDGEVRKFEELSEDIAGSVASVCHLLRTCAQSAA